MGKAILSNRIYLDCEKGSDLDLQLRTDLMYEISQQPVSEYPLIINNCMRITDTVLSIPSGRLDLIPEDYEVVDRRISVPVELPAPKFNPRENQAEAIAHITGNGIINAKVGWGKTIAGLGLIHKFKEKTLIVTTTTAIRDMWIGEIRKWFGIEAGVIGGGKFETNNPICVGNIQTVRNKTTELASTFGMIICDEVHRTPAKTFTDTLNALRSKHKVGLSGTLKRKDGLHCVLPDYFGDDLFVARVENTINPVVHSWDSGIALSANEFIPWATKITELVTNDLYRAHILNLANTYAELGHKVLVLCDRTELLEWGHTMTDNYSLLVTGKIKGSDVRQRILDAMGDLDSEASILWGTQSIFSEGVSVNALSCVILATPINNEPLLEQICGRVMRKAEGKLLPVICDIGLTGSTGNRHRNARKKFYIGKGWDIKHQGLITT